MENKSLQPPLPRSERRIRVLHNDVTIDSYGWLRDREDPDVLAYLEAENHYADEVTSYVAELKADLIAEIEKRDSCDGAPPPFQVGFFFYFQKSQSGLLHSAWWRRPVTGGPEELVFDPNTLPGAEVFYSLGALEPSDDGRYIAFSFDLIGNERYELRVRDMTNGREIWRDPSRAGRLVWAADNRTLFFTRERADRRQHDRVVRLDVETGRSEVVFEEVNERLALVVRRSGSGAYLFIDVIITSDMSSRIQRAAAEVWCLPAERPTDMWRRILARELGHEIYAEHWGNEFLFRVNDTGPNLRLVRTAIDDTSPSRWQEVVPHRAGITLEEIHVLEEHVIVLEREGIQPRLVAHHRNGRVGPSIVPVEHSCTVTVGLSAGGSYSCARHPYRVSALTYKICSFVTPDIFIQHDLLTDKSKVLYRTLVSGFEPELYEARVVMAKAEDGVEVPISIVARRDRGEDGPVLLNVYGCYGAQSLPAFFGWPSSMTARLSLLDRGVAFGIVHVRGGGELGRAWHEAATRDQKRLTHTDLIAAAECLVEHRFASRDGIVIEGRSAGGGTVLAAAVLRPDLFRAVLAEVPLADIIDTELDFTLPYALRETAEYGDPHLANDYQYLRSYDPYYNLTPDRRYPPTYIDAALHDSQVLYYQPARYVAQRRSKAVDRDPDLIFRTRMIGGHMGVSHGPGVAEEAAFRMAWILHRLGQSGR
ncbi:probable peptidase of the S9A family (plasmid) [Sinorhizobium fredii NGR234]|uniref:Uncharacterized peptidase y4sO n=1 Tax=Sinorhizobium fredii (strain NBRC 101917 / NGR234) TaxID=394 RepID=Y4SO_SINFN|nr:prolyl oligopeptidase family serine peptidase [Sinorhizobium fredii]P55656.1 RecName: Full=Uncharacterized peptidase y4sO [Sinorhizobium fredii NGR234]AAB91854.1 probable peptidase of the S9A family [Sinorhizobium fredii NGR234]